MTPDAPPPERGRSRWRDVLTLHIPLVLVLTLCTVLTVVEFRRANEGVWRAWIYLFEWPLIAAFAIWMWVRFRREAGGGFARQWRERVERVRAAEVHPGQDAEPRAEGAAAADPELQAWHDYQRRIRDADGPGDGSPVS